MSKGDAFESRAERACHLLDQLLKAAARKISFGAVIRLFRPWNTDRLL
jgi:hypothetical protein